MRRSLLILMLAALGVAGCDRARAPVAQAPAPAAETDARPLMPRIAALDVEPTPSGAIVRATGLPPLQGYWDGTLEPVPSGDPSVLSFRFRTEPPEETTRVSTERSRYVNVAAFLTTAQLRGVREIRVSAAGNARAARR